MNEIIKNLQSSLPKGSITREQARQVMYAHPNLKMERESASFFALVLRDKTGFPVWQCLNYLPTSNG
ncbi:DUF905 family protein [Enterobacter hormaechei]|uniref:DUF905 family protein n=1 Tax=Enterobacter hormaechei TaxID=158836 RepID=UPI003F4313BA